MNIVAKESVLHFLTFHYLLKLVKFYHRQYLFMTVCRICFEVMKQARALMLGRKLNALSRICFFAQLNVKSLWNYCRKNNESEYDAEWFIIIFWHAYDTCAMVMQKVSTHIAFFFKNHIQLSTIFCLLALYILKIYVYFVACFVENIHTQHQERQNILSGATFQLRNS